MKPSVARALTLLLVTLTACAPVDGGSGDDVDRGPETDGLTGDAAAPTDAGPTDAMQASDGMASDGMRDGIPDSMADGLTDGTTSDAIARDMPPACDDPRRLCGGECVDTASDRRHCSACDAPCDAGETCRDGMCLADDCPDGTHDCDDTCVPDDDPATCGDRCVPCPAPQGGEGACVDGACVARCPAGALLCDGVCAPCEADPADSACDGAACACVPDCGQRVCGVDPACGTSCGACDDPDTACIGGQCLSRCQTPLDGLLTIDVPTVAVTVDLTLDGQPLDAGNTRPDDYGRVSLRDPESGEVVFNFPPIDEAGNFILPYTARVVAGTYDVVYARQAYVNDPRGQNNWPINDDRVLIRGLEIIEDGPLIIDVPTVAPLLDVTLDGAPTDARNTAPNDRGTVTLVDPETGEDVFNLTVMGQNGDLFLPWAPRVVAGEYVIRYRRDAYVNSPVGANNWPINDARVLGRVVLDDDAPRAFDVPTVAAPLDVSLDGRIADETNTAPDDRGTVTLVDPETGEDVFNLTVMGDNGDLFLPWAPRVVAGEYITRYRRDAYVNSPVGENNWPVNDARNLGRVALDDDRPQTIDVPTAAPLLDVTLDGAPTDEGNTSPDDRGTVQLVDPETGEEVFNLTVMGQNGDLFLPWAPRIVAGEYVVRYRRDAYVNVPDGANNWPINDARILRRVVLDDDMPRAFDVPTVAPLLDVTLDGEPADDGNTSVGDRGGVWLVDPETGEDVFGLSVLGDGGQFFLPWAPRVVAGEYGLEYRRAAYVNDRDAPGRWPVNDERALGRVTLDDAQPRVFDVPTAVMRVGVSLDGAGLDAGNTNAAEYGQVIVRDRESGEDVFTFTTLADGAFLLPFSARVVAGRYDAHYARNAYRNVNSDENHWPVNDDRPLQCIEVP